MCVPRLSSCWHYLVSFKPLSHRPPRSSPHPIHSIIALVGERPLHCGSVPRAWPIHWPGLLLLPRRTRHSHHALAHGWMPSVQLISLLTAPFDLTQLFITLSYAPAYAYLSRAERLINAPLYDKPCNISSPLPSSDCMAPPFRQSRTMCAR